MRQASIATFLAELERRLHCDADRRAQILAEIAEHLDDLVAEMREQGVAPSVAEARAIARFGSPRRLARGLGCRAPLPGIARAALAFGALGLSGTFAYAQLRAAPPVVAVSVATTTRPSASGAGAVTVLGQSRLVALDPVSLRVVRRGPLLLTGHVSGFTWLPPDFAFIAPDGSHVAVVADATLHYYDLRDLRLVGSTRLGTRPDAGPTRPAQKAGEADVIRAGAWLGDNVVALVQHQAAPYASRVTRRAIVVIDPRTRRVLSRHPVALKGAVIDTARTTSHEFVLACSAGHASILDVRSDGSNSISAIGSPCVGRVPTIGLAAGDSTLAVVQAGHPLIRIDLATHHLTRTILHGSRAWTSVREPQLKAVWWHGRLIVTGASFMPVGRDGTSSWPSAGVTSIDPATGNATVVTRHGSWVLPTPNRLIVGGPGLGLTAFTPDRRRVWHADGRRTVYPFGAGGTIFAPRQAKRHTVVDSYSAQTGRHLASRYQPGPGTRPFSGVTQPTG